MCVEFPLKLKQKQNKSLCRRFIHAIDCVTEEIREKDSKPKDRTDEKMG